MTAIINGKVVTVTGETYEKGIVLVEDGKIAAVGADIAVLLIAVKCGWFIFSSFIEDTNKCFHVL